MKDSAFKPGKWGKSWDEAQSECAQVGCANLANGEILLKLPCGTLLDSPAIRINGKNPQIAAEYLYGYTQENYYIILRDTEHLYGSGHIPGMFNETIHARELFASKGSRFNINNPVNKIRVDYFGLTEWYGKIAFTQTADSGRFKSLAYNKDEDQPCTIYQSNDLSLKLISEYVFPGTNIDKMVFEHRNYLSIEFESGRTVEESLMLINRLSTFLSLCMGFKSDVQSIWFTFDGSAKDVQYFTELRNTPLPSKNSFLRMPFPYKSICSDISSYLEDWLNPSDGKLAAFPYLQYAAELLVSALMCKWEMPIQPLYTTASQALESLSKYLATRDNSLAALPLPEYRANMCELKRLLRNVEKGFHDWVYCHFHGNDKGMNRLTKELIDRKKDIFQIVLLDVDSFIQLQKQYRNQYTHPSPTCNNDYVELWYMSQCICLISGALVWSFLGMSSTFIANRLEQTGYKAEIVRWAQKRFPEQDSRS